MVAYADTAQPARIFPIPQLVAPREFEARPLLPSCLFAPLATEAAADPWNEAPWILGELARQRGTEVPARLVSSSKSWLCHSGVDRTAAILPWGMDDNTLPRISPVEAATRLLVHVQRVWDQCHPKSPLAQTDVVLTVPASFDQVARELTLLAAQQAGLSVRLLEEPQAAFYDALARGASLSPGHVLVCDVGGGTTDLSLLRITPGSIERIAVGRHLLLGGDNMDLALAHHCEQVLGPLEPVRFAELVGACRIAKEQLLSGDALQTTVTVLGRGAKLVGASQSTPLTRHDCENLVIEGFFPDVALDALPVRIRSALVAFGLPYERDVAITRHVAAFCTRHGLVPDAVLLNGGVFRASRVVDRLLGVLERWRRGPVAVISGGDPDLAVARGAVAYGWALRGHGLRIGGGAARSYYVGLADGKRALCVIPRGTNEGQPCRAESYPLALTVGESVRFDLMASDERHQAGELVTVEDAGEVFTALAPVVAKFDGPKREARVVVEGELTALGTLEFSCLEVGGGRFRLAFDLRGPSPGSLGTQRARGLDDATRAIERAFGKALSETTGREAKDLVRDLEKLLGDRTAWSTSVARGLFDVLAPLVRGRRRSADHERVYWQLAGFCVRPGYGDVRDPERMELLVPLWAERLAFPAEARGWQQYWIAWRRMAGGLTEATQTLFRDQLDALLAPTEKGLKKPKWARGATPYGFDDLLAMVSSLERVGAGRRAELGEWILERTWTDRDARLWGALGRLGARVPTYASVHHVVSPWVVERWLEHLLREKWEVLPVAPFVALSLARQTGDRARDVTAKMRAEVERRLATVGAPEGWRRALREVVAVEEGDRAAFFGEGLPSGLRLDIEDPLPRVTRGPNHDTRDTRDPGLPTLG